MGTKIEWTNETWNPVTGCSVISPGCANCYAAALSHRYGWTKKPWHPQFAAENIKRHHERLRKPLTWRTPRRVFVNSMSDLFHENVSDEFIDQVFGVMALARDHTFQVLTKRPKRMLEWFNERYEVGKDFGGGWEDRHERVANASFEFSDDKNDKHWTETGGIIAFEHWPLPNVWLGVSVENQRWADERIPLLLQTPAAVRFLSVEPMLGPVSLEHSFTFESQRVDWVICGGESGPRRRPLQLDWVRSLRDQCQESGIAFFLKQLGGIRPGGPAELDGREWREFPAVAS